MKFLYILGLVNGRPIVRNNVQKMTEPKLQNKQQIDSPLEKHQSNSRGLTVHNNNASMNREEKKRSQSEMKKQPTGSAMENLQSKSQDVNDSTTTECNFHLF